MVGGSENVNLGKEFVTAWLQNDCVRTLRMNIDGNCAVDFYEFSQLAKKWLK
jgi:hypothetical protein